MRIGLIGQSEGNGHPYSWSAIINGFNNIFLDDVPFPVIKKYLRNQNPKKRLIDKTSINKIYCKDISYAKNVAHFANIPHVQKDLKNFGDNIDAIIIAKDDFKNHFNLLKKLVEFKLPILIDKPIAIKVDELKKILKLRQFDYQFFSSSGLYFSPEINLFPNNIDKIKKISAISNGSWEKYSVHLINILEKYFKILGKNFHDYNSKIINKSGNIEFSFSNLKIELELDSIKYMGVIFVFNMVDGQTKEIIFKDTYKAFSEFLKCFICQANSRNLYFNDKDFYNTVKIIEFGTYG